MTKNGFKKDLQALLPHKFFFLFLLLISYHTVFLIQFGINLHFWVFQKAHSCKSTQNRMITYTNNLTTRSKMCECESRSPHFANLFCLINSWIPNILTHIPNHSHYSAGRSASVLMLTGQNRDKIKVATLVFTNSDISLLEIEMYFLTVSFYTNISLSQ